MSELIIHQKDLKPYRVKLDKVRTTIGRSSRNDVCVSDPFASRFHVEVRREDKDFFVVDLGSANGTLLNGKRLAGQARLNSGDELRIGETLIGLATDGPRGGAGRPTSLLWTDAEPHGGPEMTISSVDVSSGIFPTVTTGGLSTATGEPAATAVSHEITGRRDLLAVVSKVGVALLSNASLDDTLRTVIDLVFEVIPVQRGFLFLKDGDDLLCKVSRTTSGNDHEPTTADIQISRSIARKVFEERVSVLTSDASHDPRFSGADSVVLSSIRSVMAVPLALSSETFGMIYVDNPYDSRFTSEDLQVLTTIAGVASIKIENARLADERLEKRRMEEELKIASEIQMRLLPACPPPVPGFQICAYSIPSREIGGDYYDYIERRRHGRLAITLGDVSGKGTGAALMMSSLHAAVRAQTQTELPIREMMSNLNDYIVENSPENKFLTLFYGELDATTGDLFYVNAGHNNPIVVRETGEVERLEATGIPIGILPEQCYAEGCVRLWRGDAIVVFSDGITESVDALGEEFGEDRLTEVVKKHLGGSANKIRDRIDEALSKFVGSTPAVDDMTLLILKREK